MDSRGDVGAGYVQSTRVSCSPARITPWTAGVMLGQGTYKVLMYHVLHQGLHHGQQGRCWGRVRTKYSCIMFSTKDYTLDSRGDVGAGYVQSTHVSCSPPRITPWTVGTMLGQGTYKVLMYHVLHQGLHPGQQGRCWGRVRTKYSCIMFSTKDYTLDSRGDVGAGYVQSTHVSCSPPRITPWTAGRCWGRVRTKYSCIMFSTKDYTLDSRGDVGAGYVQSTHVSCSPPRTTPWTAGRCWGRVRTKYSCIMFSTKDYTLDSQGDVGAGYVQSTHVSCSPPRITPWTAGVMLGQGTYRKYSCIMFSTKDYTLDSRAMLGQGTYKVLMYHVLHQGLHPGQQGDVGAGYVQSTHVSCSPPRITPWTARVMLGQGTYKVLMYHVLHQGLHPGQQG